MKQNLVFTSSILKMFSFKYVTLYNELNCGLADKHVDSFSPQLLNEAWRDTICSLLCPLAACFSSCLCWGKGTRISYSLQLYLNYWERQGKGFFKSLLLIFLINLKPVLHIPCLLCNTMLKNNLPCDIFTEPFCLMLYLK